MNPPISQNMTLAQPHTHTPQHHTIQSTILKKMPHCGKDKICFNVKHALNYYPMGSLNTETTTDQNHCAAVVCASSTTAHVSAQLMCWNDSDSELLWKHIAAVEHTSNSNNVWLPPNSTYLDIFATVINSSTIWICDLNHVFFGAVHVCVLQPSQLHFYGQSKRQQCWIKPTQLQAQKFQQALGCLTHQRTELIRFTDPATSKRHWTKFCFGLIRCSGS